MINFNSLRPGKALVRKGMYEGSEVTMKFAKEDGRFKAEFLQKIDDTFIGSGYNFKETSDKTPIISKIKKICQQTKDGLNLFAEIMSCIK